MLKQEAVSTAVAGVPYTANYNYDAMGNRTTTTNSNSSAATNTYATNALNQVTGITTSYAGKPGPFPSVGFVYDDAGNLTRTNGSDGSYTLFGYDDLDRLIIIDHRDTAGTPTTGTNFYYDYANRLVTTVELSWARVQWQIDSEKLHIYDGMDVVQERDRYNNVSAQLVRDGNIGGILSRTTAAGATFYDYDGNGNVTLLTDSAGNDVGHYRYDAFGNTLEATGPRAAENPWRFSTKELHGGWYNFGFRFYAPDIGRWINRDPISEAGGVNLYAMVGNNPVNSVDAYGLEPVVPVVLISPFTGKKDYNPHGRNGVILMKPAGVDIMANIQVAKSHSVLSNPKSSLQWFNSMVKYKGPWDYKSQIECPYTAKGWSLANEDFGNFHYGVVGRAAGIPLEVLLSAAGYAQQKDGAKSAGSGKPGLFYSPVGGTFPYGDDHRDAEMIKRGASWYDAYQKSIFFNAEFGKYRR